MIIEEYKNTTSYSYPYYGLIKEVNWIALSVIEAFFSWTEHIFVHYIVLSQQKKSGADVVKIINENWGEKFKKAFDLKDREVKKYYDDFMLMRENIRNFNTHGAFGKQGKAFKFHSSAGAVPLLMPYKKNKRKFTFFNKEIINEEKSLEIVEDFIKFLHLGKSDIIMCYIESGLPTIISFSENGTYQEKIKSKKKIEGFVDYLSMQFNNSANMDW